MKVSLPGIVMVLAACAAGIACVTAPVQPVYTRPPVVTPPPTQDSYPQDSYYEPPPEEQPSGAEDQPFYEDLSPYGRWAYVSGPGWVWAPYSVPAGWCPYQMGHWVFTDYGWTWASDEPFGWAVYHYGRWHSDPAYGWVWVPGTEWGPAWVAWHEGGGYVGWAPLPYQAQWRAGVGLDWGGLSINVAIGPTWWHFVQTRDMVDPGVRYRVVPPSRNVTLIQITHNVTNYTYIDNRVVDHSVRVENVGRAVGHPIPRYRVRAAETPEVAHGGRVRGEDFVVFRPNPVRGAKSQGRLIPPGHDGARPSGNRWQQEPAERPAPPAAPADARPQEQPPASNGDQPRSQHDERGRGRQGWQGWNRGRQPAENAPGQPPATDPGNGQPRSNEPGQSGSAPGGAQNPQNRQNGTATATGPASPHGPAGQQGNGTLQNGQHNQPDGQPGKPGQGKTPPGKGKQKKNGDSKSRNHKPDSQDSNGSGSDKSKTEKPDSGTQ
jgi:uncharacterized protein DUF6600